MSTRRIAKIFKSRPTIEGAGVHLKRAFGYFQVPQFDPFLMLDDFHTSKPDEYLAGFPWITSSGQPLRFLLISGKPLNEAIAWQGPIVMNTQEELRLAFEEYQRGTFVK